MTQPISHIREGSSEPAVQIAPSPINGVDRLAKDTLDFAFALIMIIFCAPLLLAVAILIRLDSPGPVMFTQFRYGEGGRTFRISSSARSMSPIRI